MTLHNARRSQSPGRCATAPRAPRIKAEACRRRIASMTSGENGKVASACGRESSTRPRSSHQLDQSTAVLILQFKAVNKFMAMQQSVASVTDAHVLGD